MTFLLGDCKFEVVLNPGDNPSAAAAIIYHKKRTGGNTATVYFNSRIDWNETTIRRVLIHELIHYYLFVVTGRRSFFSHGVSFVWVMLKINLLYHEHITVYWHNKIPPSPEGEDAGTPSHPRAYSMDEIGLRIGMSRERVRQIHNKAIMRLRNNSGAQRLKSYL